MGVNSDLEGRSQHSLHSSPLQRRAARSLPGRWSRDRSVIPYSLVDRFVLTWPIAIESVESGLKPPASSSDL